MNYAVIKKIIHIALCLCITLFLCAMTMAYNDQQTIYRCNVKCKDKIALTFDDGPHPKQTEKILKILEKYDIKATFFAIGANIDNYEGPLLEVSKAGHEIGNHTNSHSQLKSMPLEKICFEIEECERKVEKLTGKTTRLLRPPCGMYDDNLIEIANKKEYKIILWNIDTHDWAHCDADTMTKNVVKNVKGGDIILFHDYISGRNDTVQALDRIIPVLKSKGYEFVTISELLEK